MQPPPNALYDSLSVQKLFPKPMDLNYTAILVFPYCEFNNNYYILTRLYQNLLYINIFADGYYPFIKSDYYEGWYRKNPEQENCWLLVKPNESLEQNAYVITVSSVWKDLYCSPSEYALKIFRESTFNFIPASNPEYWQQGMFKEHTLVYFMPIPPMPLDTRRFNKFLCKTVAGNRFTNRTQSFHWIKPENLLKLAYQPELRSRIPFGITKEYCLKTLSHNAGGLYPEFISLLKDHACKETFCSTFKLI